MEIKQLLTSFVDNRDNKGKIIAAFGYGSGVFKQTGYKLQDKPMIDTIFVVKNPHQWHHENIRRNPDDYSASGRITLKYFDINSIRKTTGVTYQSNIQFEGHTFKYGIIGAEKFTNALRGNWNNFFIQGRFQKPIYTIKSTDAINKAISENREYALLVALLTLDNDHPTILDLYEKICSLSYTGDIRMLFAENPHKVANIVNGSFEQFVELYGTETDYFYTKENGELVIDYDLLYSSISLLPDTLYEYLNKSGYSANNPKQIADLINQKMAQVNRMDSIIQPLTGIITVGPFASLSYLNQKMKKKAMNK